MVKHLLIVIPCALLLFCALIYIFQRHLIYVPATKKPHQSVYHANDMTEITLTTADGLKIFAWYKPAVDKYPTILFIHGNAGHIGLRMTWMRRFLERGFGVLLLEYRGYAQNPGVPNEAGLYSDARAAIEYLKQNSISNSEIIIYGESLGCAVAVQMAYEENYCALILQSPFTSLPAIAKFHYPWALLEPWDKYNNIAKISKINTPKLLIHGTKDNIVPYYHSELLYEQSLAPKHMITLEHAGHNNLWSDEYFKAVLQFVDKHCARHNF